MRSLILIALLLQTPTVPTSKITGQVVTLPGSALPLTLTLRTYGSGPNLNLRPVPVGDDGKFEITGVGRGEYTLSIGEPFRSPARNFTMQDIDVTDFEIKVPAPITGRVQMADGSPFQANGLVVSATTPVTAVNINRAVPKTMTSRVSPDGGGNFILSAYPGANTISIEQVPAGYTIKSLAYGGLDVLRSPLNLEAAPTETLVVTLIRQ